MKNIKSFIKGLNIEPVASSSVSAEGDMEVYSNGLRIYLQAAVRVITTLDQTQTLTNKSMSGSANTFSNIPYSALILTDSIVNADIASAAAIAYSKLNLANSIVNADIATGAAIAYSKLALTGSIVDADISASAAIAYSKLALTGSIVNADISASAAIAYSKLALTGAIVNADISASAAIAFSKLAALTNGNILIGNGSNVAVSVTPSGEAAISNTGVITLDNNSVTGKVLTGYTSGAGTVASTDSILQAIQKLNGNQLLAPGDVSGPASSTDNAIARFDLTTGKIIQNSAAIVADNGGISSTITTANTAGGIAISQTFTPNPGSSGVAITAASSGTGGGGTYFGNSVTLTDSSGSDVAGFYGQIAHSGTNSAQVYGFASDISNSSAGASVFNFFAGAPGAMNATNYAGLLITGVSSGTVSGYNDAIHVTAGRSYFGGSVNINGLTASVPVVTDASKNLVSLSYADFTAALSDMVGDAGAGGTKGLAPAPGAGDAAAGKFLKADGTWAVPAGSGGDVVGPGSSVDGEVALFDGATGQLLKSATGTGVAHLTSGVLSASDVDLTSEVTGVLPMANGGTNKNMTAVNGGLVWSDADSLEVTTAGTAQQWVLSGGAGAPTMSNTTTTGKTIDGTADENQLLIQGHSTQTTDILMVQKSDATILLRVNNTAGTRIKGTTTNTTVSAGEVGEVISSTVAVALLGATNTWKEFTSITLTPGVWMMSCLWTFENNGATLTRMMAGIGTAAGDNTTGMEANDTLFDAPVPTSQRDSSCFVGGVPVRLTSNTTYYLKARGTYTVADPRVGGTLRAIRVI